MVDWRDWMDAVGSPRFPMLRLIPSIRLLCLLTGLAVHADIGDTPDETRPWAYRELTPGPVPRGTGAVRNPVDAFIRAGLTKTGLEPALETDRATLLRRVTFDLTGLPPTLDELRAFLGDAAPDAYERVVDRLLASPHYGERWARHWLDLAHFAETHGHDQDRIRTHAWPYRDYLIRSFNRDTPYAQFIGEQVAGDVLYPTDPWATVALGFAAGGPWDESSLRDIREDTLDRQIGRYLDRDDLLTTVMSVVTSTTVHCARCHDHKFDPIPQRDYYALQAVFAGVERANRMVDFDPDIHVRRQELRRRQLRVERRDAKYLGSEESLKAAARWEAATGPRVVTWTTLRPQVHVSTGGATLTLLEDGSVLAGGDRPERDSYGFSIEGPLPELRALRLEVLPHESLPQNGPGRADNGNLHLSEIRVQVFEPGTAQGKDVVLVDPRADFNQADWTVAHSVDGDDKTAWGIHPQVGKAHQALYGLKEPLKVGPESRLVVTLRQVHGGGHLIGRARLSASGTSLSKELLPVAINDLLAIPASERTPEQVHEIVAHALGGTIHKELEALGPPSWVYAVAHDFEPDGSLKPLAAPREVRVLRRGEITRPLEPATPGTLSGVGQLPARFEVEEGAGEGARRAALARWLTDRDNPLTWRSIVNRVWQQHFGRGLVDTPNDFGLMGSRPSHPELLDWLAIWFRDDAGGSMKQLHRLLVTSATYRQSTKRAVTAAGQDEVDPENRLLSRMNRTRLDAECVRDALLQWAGHLDLRMGGPGDRQFDLQPGIHVTPRVDYTVFDPASAPGNRRSIHRFLFRTLPDPFFEALDCPAGDQLTPVRNNTVTVQQALAMWNNPLMTVQSERIAHRLERETGTVESRVERACEMVWGRLPEAGERSELVGYARAHGLANLCRLLLNSNEFVFVN